MADTEKVKTYFITSADIDEVTDDDILSMINDVDNPIIIEDPNPVPVDPGEIDINGPGGTNPDL